MNAIEAVSSATDPPIEKTKPKFLSFAWFVLFFSALAVWKYTPKDWGVWNVSSYVTLAQVFCATQVYEFIKVNAPWVLTGLGSLASFGKAVAAKVVVVTVAVWEVIGPG